MKVNLPTTITIKSITINNLHETDWPSIIKVECTLSSLGQFRKENNHVIMMSTQLSPILKEEIKRILDRDLGLLVEELQKESDEFK